MKFAFPKRKPRMVFGGPVPLPKIIEGIKTVEEWNPGAPHYILSFGKLFIIFSPTLKPGEER